MAQVVFVPNVGAYAREFQLPGGMVERHIAKIARGTAMDAHITAPRRTGAMANSITPRPTGGTDWKITAHTGYAVFVHEGTRRHPIFPKKAGGLLVFNWPKAAMFGLKNPVHLRSVMHPGTKAQPFLLEALDRVHGHFTLR
jgi:hypothetical protein